MALTFEQALEKGYPEFRRDQPRDPKTGKWSGGKGNRYINISGHRESFKTTRAVRAVIQRIPEEHWRLALKKGDVRFGIMKDMAHLFDNATGEKPTGMITGFFEQDERRIWVGEKYGEHTLSDVEGIATHEFGHLLDHDFGLSEKIQGIIAKGVSGPPSRATLWS